MPLPLHTLRNVAVVTGFVTLGGSAFFYKKIQDNLISGTYYTKSLTILKDHESARNLLGLPIKTKYIDMGDSFNRIDGNGGVAELAIPLRGSKHNGTLYTWSTRDAPGQDWTVQKVELKLKDSATSQTIYLRSAVESSED